MSRRRARPEASGPRLAAATPAAEFERVVRRLATVIGHGDQGAALARALAHEGVRTRADLKKPAVLARLPRESQASVLHNPARNVPLAAAEAVAAEVKRRLVFDFTGEGDARPLRFEVLPVGSVRRRAPRVKDIDFLVVVPADHEARLNRVLAAAVLRPPRAGDRLEIADTYAAGARRRSFIVCRRGGTLKAACYRADLFLTTAGERAFALFHYTGPASYNIRTRAHAKRQGWLLNQYGLFDAGTGQRVRGSSAIRTERDLARFLGVTYHTPRERDENAGRRGGATGFASQRITSE